MTDWEAVAEVRQGQIDHLLHRIANLEAGRRIEQQMLRNAVDTIQEQTTRIAELERGQVRFPAGTRVAFIGPGTSNWRNRPGTVVGIADQRLVQFDDYAIHNEVPVRHLRSLEGE
jgi:hypothetical protein